MNKVRKFWIKYKFAEESLYNYGNLKNRKKFEKSLDFYRLKTAIEVGICILLAQILLLVLLGVAL